MDAALLRRVEEQRVALLYGNTLAVSGSSLLMAALVAIIVWPQASAIAVFGWCGAVVLVQAGTQWLSSEYRRAADASAEPRAWGQRFTIAAGIAGVVWGAVVFVLVGADQSLML